MPRVIRIASFREDIITVTKQIETELLSAIGSCRVLYLVTRHINHSDEKNHSLLTAWTVPVPDGSQKTPNKKRAFLVNLNSWWSVNDMIACYMKSFVYVRRHCDSLILLTSQSRCRSTNNQAFHATTIVINCKNTWLQTGCCRSLGKEPAKSGAVERIGDTFAHGKVDDNNGDKEGVALIALLGNFSNHNWLLCRLNTVIIFHYTVVAFERTRAIATNLWHR